MPQGKLWRRFWVQLAIVAVAWLITIWVVHGQTRRDLDFACDVERVIDGDTIRCVDMVAALRIWGVDALEESCSLTTNSRLIFELRAKKIGAGQ